MPELKSCPFCGNGAEMDTMHAYRNFQTGAMETGVSIYCTGCSANMIFCYPDFPGADREGLHSTIADDWNRRSTP